MRSFFIYCYETSITPVRLADRAESDGAIDLRNRCAHIHSVK